jgi:hypothetical protein
MYRNVTFSHDYYITKYMDQCIHLATDYLVAYSHTQICNLVGMNPWVSHNPSMICDSNGLLVQQSPEICTDTVMQTT